MKYYSCREIEKGVHFYRDKLNFCCVDFAPGKGFVKIVDYKGGELPIDEMIQARKELRELNQSNNEDSPCYGCPRLELKDWGEDNNKYDFIALGNYNLCNITCSYCYMDKWNKEYRSEQAIPLYNILDALKQMIKNEYVEKDVQLVWAGGEPTLYKEFEDVYTLLKENNITSHSYIYTNCTKFSQSIFDGLKEGTFNINCSLDAGTEETYKKIKRVNLFAKVKANLKKYYSANPNNIILKYIILDTNYEQNEIESFIELCKEIGIGDIVIAKDVFSNKLEEDKLLDSFAYLAFLAEKNNIGYLYEKTIFNPSQVIKIQLRILKYLIDSEHTSKHALKNHKFSEMAEKIFTSGVLNVDLNFFLDASKEKRDNANSEEVSVLFKLVENSLQYSKDYESAINILLQILTLDPENDKAYSLLGDVYCLLQNYENAVTSYSMAVELNPLNKTTYIKLSELFLDLGDILYAQKYLLQYMNLIAGDRDIAELNNKIIAAEKVLNEYSENELENNQNFEPNELNAYASKQEIITQSLEQNFIDDFSYGKNY